MSNLPVRQDFMASRPAADAQRFFAMGPLSELASHRCTRAKQGLGRIQQSFSVMVRNTTAVLNGLAIGRIPMKVTTAIVIKLPIMPSACKSDERDALALNQVREALPLR